MSDEERDRLLLSVFVTAFPDGLEPCVFQTFIKNLLQILAIYPPRDSTPDNPYANATSEYINNVFGSDFADKFNWHDFASVMSPGICKHVKLDEIRRILLSTPSLVADCLARMCKTLDENNVVYVAGRIPEEMFSLLMSWGAVVEEEAPGRFGVGRYRIDGKLVYAICARHPSSAITACGDGNARRALDRDLNVILATLKLCQHGYGIHELDERIEEIVSEQVKAFMEGAEKVQQYLDIPMGPGGWWPTKMRVMRTLNLGDPEFYNTIKWLCETKRIPKKRIRDLLSVGGVARRILHEEFKDMFDALHVRLGDLELVLSVLCGIGNTRHLTKDAKFCIDLFRRLC
jgi:hypothetical protein